jgi:hypothetical protein
MNKPDAIKKYWLVLFNILIIAGFFNANAQVHPFSVSSSPWDEKYGNHRAVISIDKLSDVVGLDLTWRRHDRSPEAKRFLIIDAQSGDTIKNIYRLEVNNEKCRLVFGPVLKTGTYYFYYLPYEVQKDYGFYGKGYYKPEPLPESTWLNHNQLESKSKKSSYPFAKVLEIQSRSAFDSFYPMEIIPLATEKKVFLEKYTNDFILFPEERKFPIRMNDELPLKWVKSGPSKVLLAEAAKNEYYAFQIGFFASKKDIENVKISFSILQGNKFSLNPDAFTCFNAGGTGPYGEKFEKKISVKQGDVQALWMGIDLPESIPSGNYRAKVTISADNVQPQQVEIKLKVNNQILADRGDNEPWRHSRLRWLNSTLGIDDEPTFPYKPIEFIGENNYRLTNKTFSLAQSGFPGSLKVGNNELLARPIQLVVEGVNSTENFSEPENVQLLKNQKGKLAGGWESHSSNFDMTGVGEIESDGYIHYKLELTAKSEIVINDIRLEIPLNSSCAQYMMGMGLPGTVVPETHDAKWNGPYDSFWMGNSYVGLWCEFRGSSYHGPLLNLYRPAPPTSWNNNGKGGFKIQRNGTETNITAYSGRRQLSSGEKLTFEWAMLLTPVKDINQESQFTERYYHNGGAPMPTDDDLGNGIKIVNLHHANNYNPHINYPFIAVDSMKWFVNQLHAKGQKVKIYYTIRELTNYTTELWALRSLGDEILGTGKGGGYPWLREHLIDNYYPQWYQWFPDKSADASIVNAPGDSRWYNYYIEGLAWLVKNVDIDGLYLDDVSYDRRTVKRIRKVLDNIKPGCLLDLHSNTGFSKGPATQYAEYFPYMDKIWFGESFMYSQMPPENWLVEVSGIPFGLMGDMLHGGGNRWLGTLFGMTVRYPWLTEGVNCDPRPVWKIWDKFGIARSKMTGFWEDSCPITTTNDKVKVTVFRNQDNFLLAIGNWNDNATSVSLQIDWKALGLIANQYHLLAPFVKDFQEETSFTLTQKIMVDPKKGWLIYLKKN